MKIKVIVKTGKKEEKIEVHNEREFFVFTKERAVENKANQDIIRQLAEHFGVSKSWVVLISGKTSKIKIFEITG
jgi:hypothetical protein